MKKNALEPAVFKRKLMLEQTGNIWNELGIADAICFTTNGVVKSNGRLVMGAGIALQARDRFPDLDLKLGKLVIQYGNRPMRVIKVGKTSIVSFPTKDNFKFPSKLELIIKSAQFLFQMTDKFEWQKVVMPPPGCGLGKLNWQEVRKELSFLDNRFIIYSKSR